MLNNFINAVYGTCMVILWLTLHVIGFLLIQSGNLVSQLTDRYIFNINQTISVFLERMNLDVDA